MTGHPRVGPRPAGDDDRTLEGFRRDYLVAFLRYLPRREEVALAAGYELGRSALRDGVSAIDIVRIHHAVLADVLLSDRPDQGPESLRDATRQIVDLAADFLAEVIAATDMVQRSLLESSTAKDSEPSGRPARVDASGDTA